MSGTSTSCAPTAAMRSAPSSPTAESARKFTIPSRFTCSPPSSISVTKKATSPRPIVRRSKSSPSPSSPSSAKTSSRLSSMRLPSSLTDELRRFETISTRVIHVGHDVPKDTYELHPSTGFNQNERAPQIAVVAAIAMLPMPDHNHVDVNKSRNNQHSGGDTAKGARKI